MRVQTVVIGAGVMGLATARALALRGREVLVVESERRIGSVTSSRSSEVRCEAIGDRRHNREQPVAQHTAQLCLSTVSLCVYVNTT